MASVEIIWHGGSCPYQAEGFIGGHPFYFRLRGNHWSLEICHEKYHSSDYLDWVGRFRDPWEYCEEYKPDQEYKEEEFRQFLGKAIIDLWEKRKRLDNGREGV